LPQRSNQLGLHFIRQGIESMVERAPIAFQHHVEILQGSIQIEGMEMLRADQTCPALFFSFTSVGGRGRAREPTLPEPPRLW
jgi:hypothetical protein